MTLKNKQFGFREAEKVVELLEFSFKVSLGSHHHYKNSDSGKKATLPKYKTPYSNRLLGDIASQLGISTKRFIELATDKNAFKEEKKKRMQKH